MFYTIEANGGIHVFFLHTLLQAMKLAILYKSHTSLQTLTDNAQRDKS